MRKSVMMFCLSLVVALPIYPAKPSTADSQKEKPIQFSFSNPRGDVVIAYARISAEYGVNRSQAFARLSPTMQADVWMLHLDYFLQDHDDLTVRQRAVIDEAIRFIESGPFKVAQESQAWIENVEISKHLGERALTAFGPDLAYETFAHLGPHDPYSNLASFPGVGLPRFDAGASSPAPLGGPMPDCECATDDDWCCVGDCPTSSTPKCHPNLDHCMPHIGCGWFWQSACNGTCGA